LLAGNDLRSMPPATAEILMNAEVIAVNQDKLGKQGKRISKSGDQEVWARPLQGGATAVGLFNRAAEPAKVTANWASLGVNGSPKIRDLWAHKDVASTGPEYEATVPGHGVVILRVK